MLQKYQDLSINVEMNSKKLDELGLKIERHSSLSKVDKYEKGNIEKESIELKIMERKLEVSIAEVKGSCDKVIL
jgi:hypothetical protein